ncbi:hypothetical protein VE04_03959, partial [Pseudogymnoascus sp. 24MN13]
MRRRDRVDGAVRQDETIALHGETTRWMTVYEMQWPWGALHALVLVLGIAFVGATVGKGGRLWKGSALATMPGGVEGETVEEVEGRRRRGVIRKERVGSL